MLLPLQLQLNLYDSTASLTADGGALTLTGGTATLTATGLSATLTATGGTLTLWGGTATLPIAFTATGGAITLTGGTATLTDTQNRILSATGGALTLTGGTATLTDSSAPVVTAKSRTGRSKPRRYYSVEVEGEIFVFATVADVEAFLATVRREAEEQADRIVTTPVVPKPPKIKVKTAKGKASTSKTVQEAVKKTQKAVNRAYVQAAKRHEMNQEISRLITEKLEREDEETILMMLM